MPNAAGILFVHDGRVLLLKRSPDAADAPSTWGFPGGHIEKGETPEQAARRETQEETSVMYNGPLQYLYDDGDFCCYGAAMPEDLAQFDTQAALNDEHTDAGWFAFDDLPEPLHPGMMELTKMPLIEGKSDKARSENIATEIKAGKSPAQAAAIGYSVQRKAGGKDRGMARDEDTAGMLESLRKCAEECCMMGGTKAYDRKRK